MAGAENVWNRLTPKEEIIDKIREAGIVGMGGAGFPTHVKLSPKEPEKIEYIIANCAECEPYLTSDYRRMVEQPEKLVEGMRIILQLFPHAKGVFGVEDNKPDCIQKLRELTAGEDRMTVVPLMTKYPQGGERQLIYAVTGRSINSKMLPADVGCIVDNVDTDGVYLPCGGTGAASEQPDLLRLRGMRSWIQETFMSVRRTSYRNFWRRPGGLPNGAGEDDFRRPDDGIRPV